MEISETLAKLDNEINELDRRIPELQSALLREEETRQHLRRELNEFAATLSRSEREGLGVLIRAALHLLGEE